MKPVNSVRGWLEAKGFGHFVELFEENEIDREVLGQLTNDDLKELGLPLGARKKLLRAIAELGTDRKLASARTTPSTGWRDTVRRA